MCKLLPADRLINLGTNVKDITIQHDAFDSRIKEITRHLDVSSDVATISHELGHSIDMKDGVIGKFSQDEELINIYNKEMENFKAKYPKLVQNVIRYFSQEGGKGAYDDTNTGLSEFLAETNMLMTTYGNNYNE